VTAPGRDNQPEGDGGSIRGVPFSTATRWVIAVVCLLLTVWFIRKVGSLIWPFMWALLAAYIVTPIVNFCQQRLHIPRVLVVVGLLVVLASAIIVLSRYMIPWLQDQLTYFAQDLPKLSGALVNRVGAKPFGINISAVEEQLADRLNSTTSNTNASIHLLTSAVSVIIRFLIFLFTTIYLLLDGPRLRRNVIRLIPSAYRPEIGQLGRRINATWMSYIRGELALFAIMTVASFIGLSILQVPGALPLAVATGVLELVPLIGPYTAGSLAVSVAYLTGLNPFGWGQITYGIVVALMYLGLRETEDYFVIPRVLGHAVKLHPLVILFALTAGGITAGLFGLLVAVPVAATLKIVGAYVYDKVMLQSPEFAAVHGVDTSPESQ
jgi:predicted PurR-regulated permease PerM